MAAFQPPLVQSVDGPACLFMIPTVVWDDWLTFLPAAASLLALLIFWRPLKRLGSRSLTLAEKPALAPSKNTGRLVEPRMPGTELGRRPKPQPYVKPPRPNRLRTNLGANTRYRELIEKALLTTAII